MKSSEIASLDNPLVKHLVKLRTNREYRYQKKSVLVTGLKLIKEIVKEVFFKAIIIESDCALPSFIPEGSLIYRVSSPILKKISGLDHPEPIVAEVEMPAFKPLIGVNFLLILDGVSDPGNMGTLLRSALGLKWDAVFIAPNCTDPFNEKALRAAKGATFRLPISSGTWEDLIKIVQSNSMQVYLAEIKGESFEKISFKPPLALILSNESIGASERAKEISESISIPIHPHMESLNVATAGAILMYTLRLN